jgi:hypothetical protein
MIRTQISLTQEQADRLRELSAALGLSQAAVIREALDRYLRNDSAPVRLRRAREPVGAYRSGRRSTAIGHDEALDEPFST